MPLRNSGMYALCGDTSDIGEMLIHTSLNSFDFCACLVGVGKREGVGDRQWEALYVIKHWVFNKMFEIIKSYNNINL